MSGQLWFNTLGDGATTRLTYLNTAGSTQVHVVDNDPVVMGNTPSEVVVDTAANLYFILSANSAGARTVLAGRLDSAAAPTQVFSFSSTLFIDGLEIDPIGRRLFFAVLDENSTANTGIQQLSYNSSTAAVTNNGFILTAATVGSSTFSPYMLSYDPASNNLFFTEYFYSAGAVGSGANSLDRINVSNPAGTLTRVVTESQFPHNFSNGQIYDPELDPSTGTLYFSVKGEFAPGVAGYDPNDNAIYRVSATAGAGSTATKVTLNWNGTNSANFYPEAITLDPSTRELYVSSEQVGADSAASDDTIFVFQLDSAGTSATLVRSIVPAISAFGNIGQLQFHTNPTLSGLTASAAASEQGAAVTLSAPPTLTDYEAGHLSSATVRISGGTFSSNETSANDDHLTVAGQITGTIAGTSIVVSWNSATETLTLTGYDTLANYRTVLGLVQYNATGDNPTNYELNPTRTLTWTVSDGAPGLPVTTNTATTTLNITAANDAPALTAGGTLAYSEGGAAAVISSAVTVGDVDSANFDTGNLTVSFSANGTTSDQLTIGNQGSGAGQIGVSGSTVSYGGVAIGTVSGGANGAALVISLNASATPTAVQALARDIQFSNTSENPSGATRTVSFSVSDGDGGTTAATSSVTVTGSNDAPSLSAGGNLSYTENGAPAAIAPGATVADADSPAMGGGSLTASFTAGGTAADQLTIGNQGGGAGQIGVSGSNVSYEGVLIGTFSGGANGAALTIDLNSSASPAAVQALARDILYSNSSDTPSTAGQTVGFTVTDGAGGSASASSSISVTAVNDPPAVAAGGTLAYTEGGAAAAISSGVTVSDLDSTNFDTGSLAVSFAANGTAADQLTIGNQGTGSGQIGVSGSTVSYGGVAIGTFSGGANGAALTVSLNASATPAAVQALARDILFSNTSQSPSTATRTVSFSVSDGDGGTSAATAGVTVAGVNDAPTVTAGGTLNYTTGPAAAVIAPTAAVADLDSANFQGGSLTVAFTAGGAAEDQLSIRDQGDGAGQIGVDGGAVSFGGVQIGTVSGGANGAPLVVSLNAAATPQAVQALARNIAYGNEAEDPSTANRTVTFTVVDGDGGTDTGSATATIKVGAPGRDIDGSSGAETLSGGAGPDQISGSAGADSLSGLGGNDTLRGSTGADTLSGGPGADVLDGQTQDDDLRGGDDADTLFGRAGDDRLAGDAGDDRLDGDDGDDTALGGDGADKLYGRDGADSLDGGAGADVIDGGADDDKAVGGAGADSLNGRAGADSLAGGDGADRLTGDVGDDTLAGDGDDDRLMGDEGDDDLSGGAGGDVLDGGADNDSLDGGSGTDSLYGGNGGDTLAGGEDVDRLMGEEGADSLAGAGGDDSLDGGAGADTIDGGAGADRVLGRDGNDLLKAGTGGDSLYGGAGDDTLVTSAGDDFINGAEGADRIEYTRGGQDEVGKFSSDEGDRVILEAGYDFEVDDSARGAVATFEDGSALTFVGVTSSGLGDWYDYA